MNSAEIKKLARSLGADLVGIAPVERFDGLPEAADPRTLAPATRSVIVIGHRIMRGALRGIEEGTSFFNTYQCFGNDWVKNQFLSKSVFDLSCAIEREGFEAVPLLDRAYPGSAFAADLNVYAHAAGLGSVGKGGFFLTPEYGHRQRFGAIFTTLELEGDEITECDDLCKDCSACIAGCPLGAYREDGSLDLDICRACRNGASVDAADNSVDRFAASCGRACMVALEGKISNCFVEKFRKRSVWSRGLDGSPISAGNQFTGGKCPQKFESK